MHSALGLSVVAAAAAVPFASRPALWQAVGVVVVAAEAWAVVFAEEFAAAQLVAHARAVDTLVVVVAVAAVGVGVSVVVVVVAVATFVVAASAAAVVAAASLVVAESAVVDVVVEQLVAAAAVVVVVVA